MSTTIGRVNFTATIDGRRTPQDAENVGRKMGASASEGFDKTWSKGFKDTLSKQGQQAFARWDAQGRRDGGAYGKALGSRLNVFLKDAQKNFDALRLDPGFLDEFNRKFDDAGIAAGVLQKQLVTLNDEGRINATVFKAAQRQVDEWVVGQKDAATASNDHRDALAGLRMDLVDGRKAFQDFNRAMDDADGRVLKDLEHDLKAAGDAMKVFDTTTKTSRTSTRDFDLALGKLVPEFDKVSESSDGMNASWSKIPHNGRQAIIIITAVVAGLEQMATLGSAAGAGLLTVAGAATQLGIGVGVGIAAFKDLGKDLEDLPESIRPAAESFQSIGDAFGRMQDAIQATALENAVASFDSLRSTVDALIPAFEPLASVIDEALGGLAAGLAPGTQAFADLEALIRNSAPTFKTVLDTLGTLGEALLTAFSNPTMQRSIEGLVGWLDDLVRAFDEFTNSAGLDEWLNNGIRIFEAFGGLLEGVATTLNNLVTPESVERTVAFLDALTASLPFFEELIAVFGELDIFGLIAELFGTVGAALTPLLELLIPVASVINDILNVAFAQLGVLLQFITPLLLPLQIAFDVIAEVVSRVSDWFLEMNAVLGEAGVTLQDVTDDILEAFNPAIEAIGDAVEAMLPSPEEFANFINETLIPAIQEVANWVQTDLIPAIQDLAKWIESDAIPAIEAFWKWFNDDVGPIIQDVSRWLSDNADDFKFWGQVITGVLSALLNPIGFAIDAFNALFGAATAANGAARGGGGGGTPPRALASGGVLLGPEYILAGEAGREAIVPLDRPLSLVDPSVRWLAAIARGQSPTPMASGGVVGGGKVVTFADGAIVVQGATDPAATAIAVLNRASEILV